MSIATPAIINVDPLDGYIAVTLENSAPVTFNFLKRNGVYIAKTIPSSETDLGYFRDYQTKNGEQVSYVASAFDGTQESAPTAPHTGTVTLDCANIHRVTKGVNSNISGTLIQLFNLEGMTETLSRETDVLRMAALEKPKIKGSPLTGRTIECPIIIPFADRAAIVPTLKEYLKSNDLFCFRDPQTEPIFVTFPGYEMRTNFNVEMTITMWESHYNEAII